MTASSQLVIEVCKELLLSDAIMRACSSIQLFGRASVHNGQVFPSSKHLSELRETGRRHLKDVQPLPCMLQTLHPQRFSPHVHSV